MQDTTEKWHESDQVFFFFFLQRLEFFLLFPFKWLSMARSLPSSALALLELRGSMLFTGAVDQTWITYFYLSSHLAEWLWPDRERIFSPRPRKTSCATDRREERILINDTTWPQIVPQGWVLSCPGNYEAPGEPIKRRFSEANLFWFFLLSSIQKHEHLNVFICSAKSLQPLGNRLCIYFW